MMASTGTHRVAQGAGMFNLPKASFSKETQELLKGKLASYGSSNLFPFPSDDGGIKAHKLSTTSTENYSAK